MPKVEINTPAPDFTLEDFRGQTFTLSEQRESNVLLVFNRSFL